MRGVPRSLLALLIPLILALCLIAAAPPQSGGRYFSETGQSVQAGFLEFFDRHGGVARFGYPLTGEFQENGFTVQYFQNARFEWHPTNPAPFRVQLGLLGEQLHGPAQPAAQPIASSARQRARYFHETGHNVAGPFLDYWERQGALELLGFPLTEAYTSGGVTVQWFQRARLELRRGRIVPAPLGSEWRGGGSALPVSPPSVQSQSVAPASAGGFAPQQLFRRFLEGNGAIHGRLGGGMEDAQNPTIAFQPFEGGQILWRGDRNELFVLYNDRSWQQHANPWRQGLPTHGNYSPPPGRYEPLLGIGLLWRNLRGPQGRLGWATTPQADGRGIVQRFQHGLMFYNPITRQLYVLYDEGGWFSFDNPWPDQAP